MTHHFKEKKILIWIKYFILMILLVCCKQKLDQNKNELNKQKEESSLSDNERYFDKIKYLIDEYSYKELINYDNSEINYPIEDSLCFYLSKLNPKELLNNDYFKYIMGKLLEKQYLDVRNSGFLDPESFPVYNASILYDGQMSNGFALKIVVGETFNIDSIFEIYAHPWREFLCIDSVVLILDKLPQMQNDSNHQKCMYLVANNKTGGCKW